MKPHIQHLQYQNKELANLRTAEIHDLLHRLSLQLGKPAFDLLTDVMNAEQPVTSLYYQGLKNENKMPESTAYFLERNARSPLR